MTELEQKEQFALAWLRIPDDAFEAALLVFGMDTGAALKASALWVKDSDVLRIRDELLAEYGEEAFLPSKGDVARLAWQMANDKFSGTVKERVAALALYAELQGHIVKGGTNVNIDQSVKQTNNVLQVPMPASVEEWQQKASAQQRQLVENARSTH